MREDDIVNQIKEVDTYIRSLKSAQPITGDSWILYNYQGKWTTPANVRRYLVFRCKYPTIPTVVRLEFDNSFYYQLYPVGPRSRDGVHFWVLPTNENGFFIDMDYSIHSSQPGTVTVENSPPY